MWKTIIIDTQETHYSVNDEGEVKNDKTQKLLKPHIAQGYAHVGIYLEGKMKYCRVHRLVALAFLDNPECKEFVNHKDGQRSHNILDNLEWVTPSENSQHAVDTDLKRPNREKIVICYDLDGYKILEFNSISEAARQTGSLVEKIVMCCQFKRQTHNLMQWRYKPDEVEKLSPVSKPKTMAHRVAQLDKEGNTIQIYDSISKAAIAVNGSSGAIANILNKKSRQKHIRDTVGFWF